MLPYPLTNFEIQKYYQNKSKFNGVYLRNNLPKIKDGIYITNLDEGGHLIMCGHFCIGFINFMLKFARYANSFSRNKCKTILKYFQ